MTANVLQYYKKALLYLEKFCNFALVNMIIQSKKTMEYERYRPVFLNLG